MQAHKTSCHQTHICTNASLSKPPSQASCTPFPGGTDNPETGLYTITVNARMLECALHCPEPLLRSFLQVHRAKPWSKRHQTRGRNLKNLLIRISHQKILMKIDLTLLFLAHRKACKSIDIYMNLSKNGYSILLMPPLLSHKPLLSESNTRSSEPCCLI